ncbi:MAG: glycyl-radical enzyme activating protein [Mangrovibacterium sp.]
MKGIIFDIKRFAVHDGPGIRTTVFFKGCPLRCGWCHNPESIERDPECFRKTFRLNGHEFSENETIGYEISSRDLLAELRKEQIFMDESGGGITFSGGEPLFQDVFLLEMLKLCKTAGLHTAVDTSFFSAWEVISQVIKWTDLFLIDLKLMDNQAHEQYTGVSNKLILENIRKLAGLHHPFRIRIPVIPGITERKGNIRQAILFLKELEGPVPAIDLLPFHNSARQKYKRMHLNNPFEDVVSMKKEELAEIKDQFETARFIVKIGG